MSQNAKQKTPNKKAKNARSKIQTMHKSKMQQVKDTWERSLANELGRLAQGIRDVKGTNTITFMPESEAPGTKARDARRRARGARREA